MDTEPEAALFELLEPPRDLPELAEPRLGAVGAKWTKYKGGHRPCDMDVKRIHEQGVAGAPPPSPARWKRVGPNDTLLLCDIDAEDMKRKDKAAEDERDRRLRAAEEARRAARRR